MYAWEKSKSVSFSRVYVCVKAKLKLVRFFFNFFFVAPFPNSFLFFRAVQMTQFVGIYLCLFQKTFAAKFYLAEIDDKSSAQR